MAHHLTAADVVVIWTTRQTGRIHLPLILTHALCTHLRAVCRRCPLAGFLPFQGLVTTPEDPPDLPVAACPINIPRTRVVVNIKATKDTIRDTTKGTRDTKDSKEIKANKGIMAATRIGVEAEAAMAVIVEAGSEARTAITMAATAVEVVEGVTVVTRGENGVTAALLCSQRILLYLLAYSKDRRRDWTGTGV